MRLYIKQLINLPAIYQLKQLIFNPQYLLPHLYINSLNDIKIQHLIDKNIKYIVFDKDNTLTHTYSDELHPSIKDKINEFNVNFPNRLAILSNSVGSNDDDDYKDAINTSNQLGIPVIKHINKKPKCLHEVIDHFSKLDNVEVNPTEICMIGDRVLTDVVFATTNNMYAILVKPLSLIKDHPIAVIFRFIETKILLPMIKLLGYKPKNR